MNYLKKLIPAVSILLLFVWTGCDDKWSEHYNENDFILVNGSKIELFSGTVNEYMHSTDKLGKITELFDKSGVSQKLLEDQDYTVIVYPDDIFSQSIYKDSLNYASYCVSDNAISPDKLTDGLGMRTWNKKIIWFNNVEGNQYLLDNYDIEKVVKTNNGYVYYISDGVIPVRKSIYEILKGLNQDYSIFTQLVKQFEQVYFDPDINTPIGTDATGNTLYKDSLWSTRNTLMDRFTSQGSEIWNMRSEDYATTMLIPSNKIINAAVDTAMKRIPLWLGRAATQDDKIKFQKWVVRACFFNNRLKQEDFNGTEDLYGVGGYTKIIKGDNVKYGFIEEAMWRPTVQKIKAEDAIPASNGMAYFIDYLKIPNNVIINRVKSRFYQLWNNMSDEQKSKYFRWKHWKEPMIFSYGTAFSGFGNWPVLVYDYLTAIPDNQAMKDSLVCSVTYDGVLYNDKSGKLTECYLPAGEYTLSMGYQNNLLYSLSIQFNGEYLKKDMVMWAQGANYHFDRSSAGILDKNGNTLTGYPDGYNPSEWEEYDSKASAYDTDGYPVATVTIPKDGNFTITISSSDMSYLYNPAIERSASNNYQLKMYHWCLRPTSNNY